MRADDFGEVRVVKAVFALFVQRVLGSNANRRKTLRRPNIVFSRRSRFACFIGGH